MKGMIRRLVHAAMVFAVIGMVLGGATPASALAAWPVVQNGSTGPNVTAVQYLLRHRGYSLTVDGDFGPGTKSAVTSFQSANGLAADGIVGANTWGKLIVTVRQGDNNNAVRGLQTLLNKNGFSLGVDGDFGPGTNSAVRSFQSSHGLAVDGVAGPNTWQELAGSGGGGGGGGGYALPIGRSVLPRSEFDDPHHDYAAIDLPVGTGTSVYAMRGGTVSYVGGGCGYGILVSADDGASYKFCHLSSRAVASGSRVSTGQRLGASGNTGNSTGPHLHIEVNTGVLRCPQRMLLAIYDGASVPSPSSLPTSGCSY
ncbi:MAG TPA: peptidoglycan-binding protein [Herpetosiphonaceae bacterium]